MQSSSLGAKRRNVLAVESSSHRLQTRSLGTGVAALSTGGRTARVLNERLDIGRGRVSEGGEEALMFDEGKAVWI